MEILNQSWFGALVGLLGLLVGIAGLVLYVKSRIGARPMCLMRTMRLIGKSEQKLSPEIQIVFGGYSVPRLSLTHLYFWNGGQETVHGSQIVHDDPLRFSFPPADEILKAHVAKSTRPVNKVSVEVLPGKKNEGILSFDFLDPGDGARVEILHTSTKRYPQVLGTLRGIPRGIVQLTGQSLSSFDRAFTRVFKRRAVIYWAVLVSGLIAVTLGLLPSDMLRPIRNVLVGKKDLQVTDSLSALRFTLLIAGSLYVVLPLSAILARRKKYPPVLDAESSSAEQTAGSDSV